MLGQLGTKPLPGSDGLTISVIVPVHNGGENFRRCLQSLNKTLPPPAEIIVVADGDTDGSWRVAEEFGSQVVRLPSRWGGPSRPRNIGALRAGGDLLFFLDADVTVPPDVMSQVARNFTNDSSFSALFGSYDDEPAATNFLSQYKNLFHHYMHQISCEEASTFWGACGVVRRDIFLALGGFDERYRRPSIEDIELGHRMRKAGYKIRLRKDFQVKHLKRWELGSLLRADIFYRALPWTALILRDRGLINDLNLRISDRVSVLLTFGLVGSVAAAAWWPGFLVVAGLLILSLLIINAPLYRFFHRKRGLRFALPSILWHWLYFFYSGLAFSIALARSLISKGRPPRTPSRQPANDS